MYTSYDICSDITDYFRWIGVHRYSLAGTTMKDCGGREDYSGCSPNGIPWGEWAAAESNNISIEAVGRTIQQVESALQSIFGFSLCGKWEYEELPYPQRRHWPKGRYNWPMQNRAGDYKAVTLHKNKFVMAGRRKVDIIANNVDLTYYPANQTTQYQRYATLRYNLGRKATWPIHEVHLFSQDAGGGVVGPSGSTAHYRPQLRIRPILNKEETQDQAGNTIYTITVETHNLIRPLALERSGVLEKGTVRYNLCPDLNVPSTPGYGDVEQRVSIVRVYNDPCEPYAKLIYPNGFMRDCTDPPCQEQQRDACVLRTEWGNKVRLQPAKFDTANCKLTRVDDYCHCREPERVCLHYFGGCQSLCDRTYTDLDLCDEFRELIYTLVTAWLPYHSCGCECDFPMILNYQKPIEKTAYVSFDEAKSSIFRPLVQLGRVGELVALGMARGLVNRWRHATAIGSF